MQRVLRIRRVFDCKGNPKQVEKVCYFEALAEVKFKKSSGFTLCDFYSGVNENNVPNPPTPEMVDIFGTKHFGKGTKGSSYASGQVFFLPGYKLNSPLWNKTYGAFGPNNDVTANGLTYSDCSNSEALFPGLRILGKGTSVR